MIESPLSFLILPSLIKNYREKRASLDADIDRVLGEIMALLGDKE